MPVLSDAMEVSGNTTRLLACADNKLCKKCGGTMKAGGPGSGCRGPNCGRKKGSGDDGYMESLDYRERMRIKDMQEGKPGPRRFLQELVTKPIGTLPGEKAKGLRDIKNTLSKYSYRKMGYNSKTDETYDHYVNKHHGKTVSVNRNTGDWYTKEVGLSKKVAKGKGAASLGDHLNVSHKIGNRLF